jgi:hypothetical protein
MFEQENVVLRYLHWLSRSTQLETGPETHFGLLLPKPRPGPDPRSRNGRNSDAWFGRSRILVALEYLPWIDSASEIHGSHSSSSSWQKSFGQASSGRYGTRRSQRAPWSLATYEDLYLMVL